MLKLTNTKVQIILAISLLGVAGWRFLYVRDFLSGRLDYTWLLTTTTNHDVLLLTYLFGIGGSMFIAIKRFIKSRKFSTQNLQELAVRLKDNDGE